MAVFETVNSVQLVDMKWGFLFDR